MMEFSTPPNLVDLLVTIVLILSVPLLVGTYLKGPGITKGFMARVVVFGVLWILFGLVSEDLLEALTTFERMDSRTHMRTAQSLVAGLDPHFWDNIPTGNKAYAAYLYGLFSWGISVPGARALNAFFGFWGGLALANLLTPFIVFEKRRELLLAALIFFPSTVFWSSNNLKEGLTYWGVCMIFAAAFSSMPRQRNGALVLITGLLGIVAAGFMRPHVCLACIISISAMNFLGKGRKALAVLALATVPLLFLKMQEMAHYEFTAVEDVTGFLRIQEAGLRHVGGGSVHEMGQTIPVVSGIVNIFFRPFPWESRSFLMLVCAVEIWLLTLIIIRGWWRLTAPERRVVWKLPVIRSCLMFCGLMAVMFSYLPNDGLLARQRVQMVPALMIIAIIPLGARSRLRHLQVLRRMSLGFGAHEQMAAARSNPGIHARRPPKRDRDSTRHGP
jgi:hypothetical protein